MNGYILSPTAREDLVDIRDYYRKEAGYRVARRIQVEFVEAFRFLAKVPGAGHRREDLADDRSILFWAMRDFLVLYKPATSPVLIVTIVRGSQDVPAIVKRRAL